MKKQVPKMFMTIGGLFLLIGCESNQENNFVQTQEQNYKKISQNTENLKQPTSTKYTKESNDIRKSTSKNTTTTYKKYNLISEQNSISNTNQKQGIMAKPKKIEEKNTPEKKHTGKKSHKVTKKITKKTKIPPKKKREIKTKPNTPNIQGLYYTSSHYRAKYYYPASCPEWKGLSSKYLKSFNSLDEVKGFKGGRSLSPQC